MDLIVCRLINVCIQNSILFFIIRKKLQITAQTYKFRIKGINLSVMQKFKNRYGEWGLVAGAAEGLGAAFSEVLANWGFNVIMVDVDEKKMKETAVRLGSTFNVKIVTIVADLSKMDVLEMVMEKMRSLKCRFLVYNAAYGPVKDFQENSPQELDYYLDLNARMPLHMVYEFLKIVEKGQPAGILIMSSLAGLWGTQLVVPYGATKAFNHNLAEGLYYELKDLNIDVLACCAGATDTPNYRNTKPKKNLLGPTIMKPEKVARAALQKIGKKAVFVPGTTNQLNYFLLTRILPRSFSAWMMNRVMFRMYRS
jgi:short-subunit dehydrogenase